MSDIARGNGLWPTRTALSRWERPFLCIGHGGASAHARPNSMTSLATAVAMGVDVVEFDVRPCRDALVLVHDETFLGSGAAPRAISECTLADLRGAAAQNEMPTLAEALAFIKGRALLNLDLKAAGCEAEVLEQLRTHQMLPDTLISSLSPHSLRRIREIERAVLTGYSYPEDKGGAAGNPRLKRVVDAAVAAMRLTLPYRIPRMIAAARSNAVMLYHKVVSPAAVRTVHALGAKVFVWTIDDPGQLRRVHAMGVDGVASNDPHIFGSIDHRSNEAAH